MIHNQHYNLYISSCCENGGIYRAVLDQYGNIDVCNKFLLDMPMYSVATSNKKLYVLLRHPFDSSKDSGMVSFDIDKDMKLINQSEIVSTMGEVACHISVSNDDIYAVNYISGSIIKFPDNVVTHKGMSINPKRQEKAHTHFVSATPDGKYILVTDLGMDKIFTYNRNLEFICSFDTAKGAGPRHLAFSDDGKFVFCANELSSTVAAYKYHNGELSLYDEKSCLPHNCSVESTAAAIRFDKNQIYVSNRGADSIMVFDFDGHKLSTKKCFDCGGLSPRDFIIVNNFIVCTNENSDNVTVINKDGKIISEYRGIKNPLCVNWVQ